MADLSKYKQHQQNKQRKSHQPQEDELPPQEQANLKRIQDGAKKAGATLLTGGKGGLPPSLVLGVMRRDKFRCKLCGTAKDLGVHHKGGIAESKWLKKKGHDNDPNNIVTICPSCHDRIHEEARKDGTDTGGK